MTSVVFIILIAFIFALNLPLVSEGMPDLFMFTAVF